MSHLTFPLDEHLPPDIAEGVRRRIPSVDILTTIEAGMRRRLDPAYLEFAARSGRVLVTQDKHFTYLFSDIPHSGVFYLTRGSRAIGTVVELLVIAWELYSAEELVGRIEYV